MDFVLQIDINNTFRDWFVKIPIYITWMYVKHFSNIKEFRVVKFVFAFNSTYYYISS